jgi:predicted nucleic acid-binding protein
MKAAVDTSPLIFLAKLDLLELLPRPTGTTPAVLQEVAAGRPAGNAEADAVERQVKDGRLVVAKPPRRRVDAASGLDATEAGVLALAVQHRVPRIIVDDLAAIKASRLAGLEPRSTPFLLLEAMRQGRFDGPRCRAHLDALLRSGYFLSPRLYQRLVEATHEA